MKNFVTSERSIFEMEKSTEPAIRVKDGSVVKIKQKTTSMAKFTPNSFITGN